MSDSNEDFDEQAIAALGDSASDHASHDESCSSIFDMPDSDSDDSGAYDIPSSASSLHDSDQPPQKRKRFTQVFNDKCVLRNRDLVLSKPSSEASKRPRKKEAPDMRSWQLSAILRRTFSTDGNLHCFSILHTPVTVWQAWLCPWRVSSWRRMLCESKSSPKFPNVPQAHHGLAA